MVQLTDLTLKVHHTSMKMAFSIDSWGPPNMWHLQLQIILNWRIFKLLQEHHSTIYYMAIDLIVFDTSIEHLEKIVNTELCDGEVKPVAVETFLLPPHNPVPHHPNINIEAKGPKCR